MAARKCEASFFKPTTTSAVYIVYYTELLLLSNYNNVNQICGAVATIDVLWLNQQSPAREKVSEEIKVAHLSAA